MRKGGSGRPGTGEIGCLEAVADKAISHFWNARDHRGQATLGNLAHLAPKRRLLARVGDPTAKD